MSIEKHHEVIGPYILFWRITHDTDAPNPLEDGDGLGEILSVSRRHRNGNPSRIEAELADPESDAVSLSYFEHGLCQWMVGDADKSRYGGDWRWDGVAFMGIWLPDKSLMDEARDLTNAARQAKMREWAAQACEVYTQWCNGEVYAYLVDVYQARYSADGHLYDDLHDYRYETAVWEDSCCGWYGMESVKSTLKDVLENARAFCRTGEENNA